MDTIIVRFSVRFRSIVFGLVLFLGCVCGLEVRAASYTFTTIAGINDPNGYFDGTGPRRNFAGRSAWRRMVAAMCTSPTRTITSFVK